MCTRNVTDSGIFTHTGQVAKGALADERCDRTKRCVKLRAIYLLLMVQLCKRNQLGEAKKSEVRAAGSQPEREHDRDEIEATDEAKQ